MIGEIGAGIGGAVAGLGSVAIIFRWLNAKIDKKQDKTLCEKVVENFNQGLDKGEKKFDKIMDTLGEIQVDNADQFGRINQKLEDLNGKT